MNEFLSWPIIGVGTERKCYQSPIDPRRCIKVSQKSKSKQSRREMAYFSYLKSKGVPFTHIPNLYREINTKKYIGIEQEVVLNKDGSVSLSLFEHVDKFCRTSKNKDKLMHSLSELYEYLFEYNIIPSDLGLWNILIQVNGEQWKAYLIDGFGSTEVVPLPNYVYCLGRMKIKRKWKRLIDFKVIPFLKEFEN